MDVEDLDTDDEILRGPIPSDEPDMYEGSMREADVRALPRLRVSDSGRFTNPRGIAGMDMYRNPLEAMARYSGRAPEYVGADRVAQTMYPQGKLYLKKKQYAYYPRFGPGGTLERYGPSYKDADSEQKARRILHGFEGRGKYRRRIYRRRKPMYKRRIYRRGGRGLYGRGRFNFGKAFGAIGRGLKTASGFLNRHAGEVAAIGSMVAPELAPTIAKGLAVNKAAQGMLGNGLYGRGAYQTVHNNLFTGDAMGVIGGHNENQEVVISHTEYLQDVYGPASSKFTNQGLQLNPGLAENFPWLAQMAANYEEYEFIQLVFQFRSTVDPSAASNNNGATGTIIMCTNYNPDAKDFETKEAMMQYHGAASGRVTDDMVHGVECDPSLNAGVATKYTRIFNTTESKKDFDLGRFQFALVNIPSVFENSQVGELWVTYTVRLQKPKLTVALGRHLCVDRFLGISMAAGGASFSRDAVVQDQNILGCKVKFDTSVAGTVGMKVEFPDFLTGTYIVSWQVRFFNGNTPVGTSGQVVQDVYTGNVEANRQFVSVGGSASAVNRYANLNWINDDSEWLQSDNCLNVRPVVDGVDNTYTKRYGVTGTWTSVTCTVEIRPTNDQISPLFTESNGTKLLIT